MLAREAELSGASVQTVIGGALAFYLKSGLGPRYFVVAGMARPGYSAGDMSKHISPGKYYSSLKILNPPAYRKLTQNKLSEKAFYALFGVPTARFIGFFHNQKGIAANGSPLQTRTQLHALLQLKSGQRICLKPLEGWGGEGIIVAEPVKQSGSVILRDMGSDLFVEIDAVMQRFHTNSRFGGFIIEDYVEQSDQFRTFNPSSVNTIRAWVLDTPDNGIEVIGAYLRIGRADSVIDNASAGGIMCPIDLETGRICPGITKASPHRDELTRHPDHGTVLAGETIEHWESILAFCLETLRILPETRFAGLDITMTNSGPLLIETNVEPDKDGAAHANIPSIKIRNAALAYDVQ
jgi:hypothetical protein